MRVFLVTVLALLILAVSATMSQAQSMWSIHYELDKARTVSAAVYDQDGRVVRTLLRAERLQAGKHTLHWDGLDRHGRPQPAGTYTVRFLTKGPFEAEYLMSLGAGSPDRRLREKWAGNHAGAGCVAITDGAMYVGSSGAENAQARDDTRNGHRRQSRRLHRHGLDEARAIRRLSPQRPCRGRARRAGVQLSESIPEHPAG